MTSNHRVAGSDSAGSLLCAAVFYLLGNPEKLAILRAEVVANFAAINQITGASTQNLKYLRGVIEESLRIYPPAGNSQLSRVVSPGGAVIAGAFVPAGVSGTICAYEKYADNAWELRRRLQQISGSSTEAPSIFTIRTISSQSVGSRGLHITGTTICPRLIPFPSGLVVVWEGSELSPTSSTLLYEKAFQRYDGISILTTTSLH